MSLIFGKLSISQIPTKWEELIAQAIIIGGFLVVVGLITWFRKWRYVWRDWLTTLDHKKIGIMYIILANVMLLRGFVDAIMMRSQLALGTNGHPGYLKPDHFDQVFTAHGTIMIFFMAMPFMVGLLNIVVPLQIGARDVSFPYLNAISLWMTVAGAMLVNVPLLIGNFSRVGWVAYPPLSELSYSPGVGIDYYCWALQIAGAGSLMSGINFFVTIVNKRAPGMTFGRMPIFVWTAMATSMLMMAAFPILTVDLALLSFDRYLGGHFFTNTAGGDMMMFVNLFWAWGHPEVYILALPPFGIFSSVIPCFSGKPLFGYTSMIFATIGIAFISFLVWVHHFFTMGSGGNVNGFFGIMTMIIAIPTGVKVFNWLFTMYRGRIRLTVPMMWSVAFLVTFTLGGMSGVMLSLPAADFVLHNSLFLIAHFHNVLIGGTLFGFFAGYNFWFPKALGFKLDERLGKWAFWFWVVGFYCAFMPLYFLGFMGMTRRMDTTNNPAWTPYLWFALFGAILIMIGIGCQVAQLVRSFRQRERLADTTGDPWDGRMLEWSMSSPPPVYNFARLPQVSTKEPFWDKKHGIAMLFEEDKPYEAIEVPRATPYAIGIGVAAGVTGFALVWYVWWLAIAGLLGVIACIVARSFQRETEMTITPEQIARIEAGKPALFAMDNGLTYE